MSNPDVAACRAALLTACAHNFVANSVDVDDAAALMARAVHAAVDTVHVELFDVSATAAMHEIAMRAALAAAQDKP